MPLTLQKRYIIALENAGYRRHVNPRGSRYYEMTYQGEGTGLYKREHRILVGSAGALRMTRDSITDSHEVSDALREAMLEAVPNDIREAKKLYPNSAAFTVKRR